MRGGIGRQFRSRAIIRRNTSIDDGEGGWTKGFADLALDVPCRRRPAGDSDRVLADQLQATIEHVVDFLVEQDVQRGDQVIVDGYELQVETTTVPSEPRWRMAMCSETQTGA